MMPAGEYRRDPGSHVTSYGHAKVSFGGPAGKADAEREAAHMTGVHGRPFFVYRCRLGPEHYHLSVNVADLEPSPNWRGRGPEGWLRPGEARGWACTDLDRGPVGCGAFGIGRPPHHDRCPGCGTHEVARAGIAPCAARRCPDPTHRKGALTRAPGGFLTNKPGAHVRYG